MFDKIPLQLFSYFGEFLGLKEISRLSQTCKAIHQRINKDTIFFHYSKKNFGIDKLTPYFKCWKDYLRETTNIIWENKKEINPKSFEISKDGRRIYSSSWVEIIISFLFFF